MAMASETGSGDARRGRESKDRPSPATIPARLVDAGLIVGFLALAFLLGLFPLKDTDFWWHLRAGDDIRKSWSVPTVDDYTFGAEGRPWIDLHWTFQVLLSLGYEAGGVPLLTLAKSVATCAALFLLITARRRDSPIGVMTIVWIPALVVLGGRMYVRPETISLVYLSAYLAVIFRLDERPKLAYLLPFVQVLWVNVQGLFILGPVVLGFYLLSAAVVPSTWSVERKAWRRTIAQATVGVAIACLINPYALSGALYPLQLAATMSNPIFGRSIGELQSIPDFIDKAGLANPSLRFHLGTAALGLASFVIPGLWWAVTGIFRGNTSAEPAPDEKSSKRKSKGDRKPSKKSAGKSRTARSGSPTNPVIFRLLCFTAFTLLSLRATRNSHQFAAVVGTVTAWNFGEWFASMQRRRAAASGSSSIANSVSIKLIAAVAIGAMIAFVGSGRLYALLGEGRTIGLDEEPYWFPHDAVAAAGRPGMPDRSICFHNGHASLYEYAYAPDRKTFADARLEVVGPEIYQRYLEVESKIRSNAPNWKAALDEMRRPLILADNVQAASGALHATLITARDWECVWFDPVAALYVHSSYSEAIARDRVDFLARHFGRFALAEPADPVRHIQQLKAYWNIVYALVPKGGENPRPGWRDAMRPLIAIGQDHARRVRELDPSRVEGWKYDGLLEFFRELPDGSGTARFRSAFDPVLDLSSARAAHLLRRAREIDPDDGNVLATASGLYLQRGMNEAAIEVLDAFLARPAVGPDQRSSRERAAEQRVPLLRALGDAPRLDWRNKDELARLLEDCLSRGRIETAARLLERAYPIEARPWEITDRIATLLLHLGIADEARALWRDAADPPSESIRHSRLGMAALVGADLVRALDEFRQSTTADPASFDAWFGLAVAAFDSGDAATALDSSTRAAAIAPSPEAKSAAATIADLARPFANR
ncbi:MAG: hypothetical protein SFX72_18385 [Isosphaeraceae bacterium]|nr:hypothetical protein [Isosphaeraceae bacterium]